MKIRIKTLDDLKAVYATVQVRYESLFPKYRKIYQKYYPDEYAMLKKMTDDGRFSNKEYLKDLPANFYDPITLKQYNLDLQEKFNYYGFNDFAGKKLPHFDMSEDTILFLCSFAKIIEFLYLFGSVANNYYEFGEPHQSIAIDLCRYTDSRTCSYDNEDIVITDPCYVIRNDKDTNDWRKSDYGFNMEALGSFTTNKYATANTIFGDWGCTTYDTDTKEEIGQFSAEAGLVSVFSLKQIQKYNPEYDPTEHPWCATLIKNFTGDVTLAAAFDEELCEIIRYVEGKGSVNFIGTQMSL